MQRRVGNKQATFCQAGHDIICFSVNRLGEITEDMVDDPNKCASAGKKISSPEEGAKCQTELSRKIEF